MSLEDVIKEQINKKGKARIWFKDGTEQVFPIEDRVVKNE